MSPHARLFPRSRGRIALDNGTKYRLSRAFPPHTAAIPRQFSNLSVPLRRFRFDQLATVPFVRTGRSVQFQELSGKAIGHTFGSSLGHGTAPLPGSLTKSALEADVEQSQVVEA